MDPGNAGPVIIGVDLCSLRGRFPATPLLLIVQQPPRVCHRCLGMIGILNNQRKLKAAERFRQRTNCWPWELLEEKHNPSSWNCSLIEGLSAFALQRSYYTDDRVDITHFRRYLTSFIQARVVNRKPSRYSHAPTLQPIDIKRARDDWERTATNRPTIAPPIDLVSVSSDNLDGFDGSDGSESSIWSEPDPRDQGAVELTNQGTRDQPVTTQEASLPPETVTTPATTASSDLLLSKTPRAARMPMSSDTTAHSTIFYRVPSSPPSAPAISPRSRTSNSQDRNRGLNGSVMRSSRDTSQPTAHHQDHAGLAPRSATSSKARDEKRPPKRDHSAIESGSASREGIGSLSLRGMDVEAPDELIQRLEAPMREMWERLQDVTASVDSQVQSTQASEAVKLSSARNLSAQASSQLEDFEKTAVRLDTAVDAAKAELRSAESSARRTREVVASLQALLSPDVEEEKVILQRRQNEATAAVELEDKAAARVQTAESVRDIHRNSKRLDLQEEHDRAADLSEKHQQNLKLLSEERRALHLYSRLVKLGPARLLHMLSLTNLVYGLEAGLQKYCQDFPSENEASDGDTVGGTAGEEVGESIQVDATGRTSPPIW